MAVSSPPRLLVENCEASVPVYFAIFEVRWGTASSGAMMERANFMFTRLMVVQVVHVDHTAARNNPSLTRDALARIRALCTVYQVDVMGGDFNTSIYKYFAASRSLQRCSSLADSSVKSVLRGMREAINEDLERQGKLTETWLGDKNLSFNLLWPRHHTPLSSSCSTTMLSILRSCSCSNKDLKEMLLRLHI
eukprot:6487153-Amphidinium_carterae.1